MAELTDLLETGTYGNIIVYERKGVKCIRTKGRTGAQAQIAKRQASILGKASAVSAQLRMAFQPLSPELKGRKLMYRLNNALQQWLRSEPADLDESIGDIPVLKGFSFNESNFAGMNFDAVMPVNRTPGGIITVHIPAFDSPNPIYPLPFNGVINLHFMGVSCSLDEPSDITRHETRLNNDYNGTPIPARELLIPLATKPGYLTVLAVGINDQVSGILGAMWN